MCVHHTHTTVGGTSLCSRKVGEGRDTKIHYFVELVARRAQPPPPYLIVWLLLAHFVCL